MQEEVTCRPHSCLYACFRGAVTIPEWRDSPHEQATRGDEACAWAYIKKEQRVYNAEKALSRVSLH